MKISKDKIDRLKEEILGHLYRNSPKAMFTADIAKALIRDEEFTKKLLLEMEKQGFITSVKKNPEGIDYTRRMRWRLVSKVYDAYLKLEQSKVGYNEQANTYF